MCNDIIIFIDPVLRTDNMNADKLRLKACEVAHSIIVPKGIEFAQWSIPDAVTPLRRAYLFK